MGTFGPTPTAGGRGELRDWEGLWSGCKGNKNLVNKEKEQEIDQALLTLSTDDQILHTGAGRAVHAKGAQELQITANTSPHAAFPLTVSQYVILTISQSTKYFTGFYRLTNQNRSLWEPRTYGESARWHLYGESVGWASACAVCAALDSVTVEDTSVYVRELVYWKIQGNEYTYSFTLYLGQVIYKVTIRHFNELFP